MPCADVETLASDLLSRTEWMPSDIKKMVVYIRRSFASRGE
ncbi:hypothetical protein RE6C_05666 [Rhodopirellula europaea 6C]|uniref:Uncharacterized protein n=1 Tax=Rhodopirellula europaea 6C TaxID=1263867 RepID=M2A3F4_9BACT|nr:hypothetical protein RE6C_05666 [Rhodopirellula europaea 6C]